MVWRPSLSVFISKGSYVWVYIQMNPHLVFFLPSLLLIASVSAEG